MRLFSLIAICWFAAVPSRAAEVLSMTVERISERIEVRSQMLINASQPQVFAALSDYTRFAELSSRYKESRFLEPAANGTQRVYTRMEGCVLFYCKSVERYGRLTTRAPTYISAVVIPKLSDFDFGLETWNLSVAVGDDRGVRTQVDYVHDFDPKFWVPPVLGVWAIRLALEKDALKAANRIERLARQQKLITYQSGGADE
jgi:hypothetical protein